MKKLLLWCLASVLLIVAGLVANWMLAAPSHDRSWQPLYARLPIITETGGSYTVANLRNWTYAADGTGTPDWLDVEMDPNALTKVWFVVEPFGGHEAIAHTMLAFEFDDGAAYVASVEARREVGESYGGIRAGLLPIHEYMFVWTTERDMYGNSTFYTGDEIYLYELDLSSEAARAVLEAMLKETAALAVKPRWYNTFFSNCTNVLARTVNRVTPDAVPFDISWYLPGYAAEFLYEESFIKGETTFADLRSASHLTPRIREAYELNDPTAFSRALRE